MVNRYQPHVYVVPEDDADRQIADGFLPHHEVRARQVQVVPPAGGWGRAIEVFEAEYVRHLREYHAGHVVLFIDFDMKDVDRRRHVEEAVPADLKDRVFVVGALNGPETLKRELSLSFEEIGLGLADDCHVRRRTLWDHGQLRHNGGELDRMNAALRKIILGDGGTWR